MLTRRWRLAPRNLARSHVVVAPRSPRRARMGAAAAGFAALLAGAGASHAYWHHHTGFWQPQPAVAEQASELQPLTQELATTRLQARVAQARSQELERQIDTLNQSLHACQEEVTFFRKAVNGKR